MFNYCQYSTTATETIQSKHKLEHLARDEGFRVKAYHYDNGIFALAEFKADCKMHEQKIDFSGVGAQHQNGIAEQNIKTIATWARANLLHTAYHWPTHASVRLWPMAIFYTTWVSNNLPALETGLCPNEIWSQTRASSDTLR